MTEEFLIVLLMVLSVLAIMVFCIVVAREVNKDNPDKNWLGL